MELLVSWMAGETWPVNIDESEIMRISMEEMEVGH